MVGSPFIVINKNGRRTLLNTAQITCVYNVEILLTNALRRIYWEYPPEQEMAYIVRVEQQKGFLNFMFTDAAERDELLDKIIATISPSTTIDSPPGLPHTWQELAHMVPTPKYLVNGKEYVTKDEYWKAWDEWSHQEALAAVMGQSPTPPTPKPPRKPRTPRQ